VFSDRVEAHDLARQDPDYVDLLRRVLAIQADCEIGGPHLYVDGGHLPGDTFRGTPSGGPFPPSPLLGSRGGPGG
jgi:hypothetical protein